MCASPAKLDPATPPGVPDAWRPTSVVLPALGLQPVRDWCACGKGRPLLQGAYQDAEAAATALQAVAPVGAQLLAHEALCIPEPT